MAYICKSARNVRFLRLVDKPILSDLHGSGCIAAAVIIVIFACVVAAYFLCCALCVVRMLCGFVVRYIPFVLSAVMWFSVLPHALCRPFPAVCHL